MTDPKPFLESLRHSQDRLAAAVTTFGAAELATRSYCNDWSIAQVLSHLGSQAEIFSLFLEAGLDGTPPPDQSAFRPIWQAWDAREPDVQARDAVAVNEAFVRRIEALDKQRLTAFRLDLFGMDLDAAGLLRLRLAEHAIHSWDITVTFNRGSRVAGDAVELLVDGLGDMVARVGKIVERPVVIAVTTRAPERWFTLYTGGVTLEPGSPPSPDASLNLTAEALLRLVYGRLDDAHLIEGEVEATGIEFDELRNVFTGV
jgi:uncharacterized protein (TIGR03083 family)